MQNPYTDPKKSQYRFRRSNKSLLLAIQIAKFLSIILVLLFSFWMFLLSRRNTLGAVFSTMAAKSIKSPTTTTSSTLAAAAIEDVMPKIGLGTYLMDNEKIATILPKAILDYGYRRIDCAPVYFNEKEIGDALETIITKDDSSERSIKRSDLFITSKLASPFHRREHVEIGLRKTLTDLKLDYLDLYLVHWPVAFHYVDIDPTVRGYANEDIDDSKDGEAIDLTVSLWETWQGMQDLVNKKLVKYIGLSNVPVALLIELLGHQPQIVPSVNQVELHPYLSQTNLLKFCQHNNVHVQAYSPLGTPGYKETEEPSLLEEPILKEIAKKHNLSSTAEVALLWALQRKTSVVCKSSSEVHLKSNIDILSKGITLTAEDVIEIGKLERNYRFFRPDDWWGKYAPVFD